MTLTLEGISGLQNEIMYGLPSPSLNISIRKLWSIKLKKRYDLPGKVPICSVTVNDLAQIGDALSEDIDDLVRPVKLRVDQVDGTFTIEDYHDIVKHDNLITTFRQVRFYLSSETLQDYSSVQSIQLTLGRSDCCLSISGSNENWVRGNLGRIQNVLKGKEANIWYRSMRLLYYFTALTSLSLCMINLRLGLTGNVFFAASGLLFSILFICSLLSLGKVVRGDWFPQTLFRSTQNATNIEYVDKIKIILALVTFIVAIAAMIFAAIPVFSTIPIKRP